MLHFLDVGDQEKNSNWSSAWLKVDYSTDRQNFSGSDCKPCRSLFKKKCYSCSIAFMVIFHPDKKFCPYQSHQCFINIFVDSNSTVVVFIIQNTINGFMDPSATSPASIQISFKPASRNRFPRTDKALQIVWNATILRTIFEKSSFAFRLFHEWLLHTRLDP